MRQALRHVAVGGGVLAAVLAAAPAAAKCCDLEYVLVPDFRGERIRIEAAALERRLEPWEMQLVSWPVLNGTAKGDERPEGHLGPGYLVVYVHEGGGDENPVVVRERVYPFARPRPVAFTLRGQTQSWNGQDWGTRPVEWGWRPIEEGIVSALFTRSPKLPRERGFPWPPLVAGIVVTAGGAVSIARRRVDRGRTRTVSAT